MKLKLTRGPFKCVPKGDGRHTERVRRLFGHPDSGPTEAASAGHPLPASPRSSAQSVRRIRAEIPRLGSASPVPHASVEDLPDVADQPAVPTAFRPFDELISDLVEPLFADLKARDLLALATTCKAMRDVVTHDASTRRRIDAARVADLFLRQMRPIDAPMSSVESFVPTESLPRELAATAKHLHRDDAMTFADRFFLDNGRERHGAAFAAGLGAVAAAMPPGPTRDEFVARVVSHIDHIPESFQLATDRDDEKARAARANVLVNLMSTAYTLDETTLAGLFEMARDPGKVDARLLIEESGLDQTLIQNGPFDWPPVLGSSRAILDMAASQLPALRARRMDHEGIIMLLLGTFSRGNGLVDGRAFREWLRDTVSAEIMSRPVDERDRLLRDVRVHQDAAIQRQLPADERDAWRAAFTPAADA